MGTPEPDLREIGRPTFRDGVFCPQSHRVKVIGYCDLGNTYSDSRRNHRHARNPVSRAN